MKKIIFHLLFILICFLSLSAHSQDEAILEESSGSKVKIVSITPPTPIALKDGETVTISAEVEYFLANPTGSLEVFVQSDDGESLLVNSTKSVQISNGKGLVTLSAEVLVKNTYSVHFMVALYHNARQSTSVATQRSYVVNKL